MSANAAQQKAIFGGGCFWCMQPVFDATDGVSDTQVGYTGGTKETANYDSVSSGDTDHVEVIQITYDPNKVSYEKLISLFWENIDPFDANGQFADKGRQYQTVIYYNGNEEKKIAEASKSALQVKMPDKPIATRIAPATTFYEAEDYHQDYYKKNSLRYNMYKHGSGRVLRLKELWGE